MNDATPVPPPPSETVAALAAHTLRQGADFLDALAGNNANVAERLRHLADVSRRVAGALPDAPLKDSAGTVKRDDLNGRLAGSERIWTLAEVGVLLLAETTDIMQALRAGDASPAPSAESIHAFREARELLDIAPNARLGARLRELRPCLRDMRAILAGWGKARALSPWLLESVLENAGFRAAARDSYAMMMDGDFDALPAPGQRVWAEMLAGPWSQRNDIVPELSADEQARIEHAARNPRMPWSRVPLLPGDWLELPPESAAAVLKRIGRQYRVGQAKVAVVVAQACDRVRTRSLACYDGAVLVEVQGYPGGVRPGIASFLLVGNATHAADGGSAWIHDVNDAIGVRLSGRQAQLDYLRLFLNHMRASGNRFQPVETAGALLERAIDAASVRALCEAHARPMVGIGHDAEGRRLFRAVLCHRDVLVDVTIALAPQGLLEMVDEKLLAVEVPLQAERMDGLFVVLDETATRQVQACR